MWIVKPPAVDTMLKRALSVPTQCLRRSQTLRSTFQVIISLFVAPDARQLLIQVSTSVFKVSQRGLATGAGPNTPHGGELKGKMLSDKSEIDAEAASCNGVTMELNDRQLCDVELLCNGSFSPLEVSPESPNASPLMDCYD
jgi:hypothetical protein